MLCVTLGLCDLEEIALCEEGCERLYNSGKYKETLDAVLACGISPYTLFRKAGEALSHLARAYTLDDEISALLAFFEDYLPRERVRDLLLLDHISKNPSCYVPKALRREDAALARVKREMGEAYPLKQGVRRAVVLLYTQACVAFADYDKKDPVTDRYEVKTVKM